MDPVLGIKLLYPDVAPLPRFCNHTALLSSWRKFRSDVVLAFCAPGLASAGEFREIPALNGHWILEIAVELPNLLPSIDGQSEAVVDVRDGSGTIRELCLSNRISRFHYRDADEPWHVLGPRTESWHGGAEVPGADNRPLIAAEEQLRTVAAMRFRLEGDDGSHAFESSIKQHLNTMFDCINAVLRAAKHCRAGFAPITRAIRWGATPFVYVLVSGDGKQSGAKLALQSGRVALIPEALDADNATRFRGIAEGSIQVDDVLQLIEEAQSSLDDGEHEFAFLQAVIAAEIATTRAVRAQCEKQGVSRTKLDGLSYAWALNIGVYLSFPPTCRPTNALIRSMDAARSTRNKLMHEAAFSMEREDLGKLIADTREYVASLRAAKGYDIPAGSQLEAHGPV